MKILVDMNLSPRWCEVHQFEGIESIHWSAIGVVSAPDSEVMAWAAAHRHVVFTHDLDFGTLLALTQASGPSVVQIRPADVRPAGAASVLIRAIRTYELDLDRGALLVVDERRSRVRFLPMNF